MRYRTLKDWQDENSPTKAEEKLIAAMQAKVWEPCVLNGGDLPDDDDPAHTIRADLLALLITGGSEACGLSPYGVNLTGAYIKGELRLTHLRAKGDTGLLKCRFDTAPNLRQARFQLLALNGSHLPGLIANGVEVAAGLKMDSITATGSVRMSGAKIGGQLSCDGATLDGKNGDALNAQGVEVGAGMFLRVKNAAGTVHVNGAKIGGQLNCEGATLDGKNGDALNAQGVEVGADLFLSVKKATGTMDVGGAKIGGQMSLRGATLDRKDGSALNMQRAAVGAEFIWRGVTVQAGHVSLASANVGDLWDDPQNWPDDLDLDGFTYDHLFGTSTRAKDRMVMLENGSTFNSQFTPQPYTQLAKVLREMGHMGEARKVLFERQRLLAAAQYWAGYRKDDGKYLFPLENPLKDLQFLGRWGFDLLLRWVVGYGYRPLNAVICLAVLFLTTTALAHAVWEEGSFAPNSDVILVSDGWQTALKADCLPPTQGCDPNPAATWSNDPQRGLDWDSFNRYGYAADLVIPVLNLGQTDAWAPSKDRGPWGLMLWWGRWVLIAAGWIVTALGVAALTGIMQRNKED